MILVDTSVWVYHFRKGETHLAQLLEESKVLCHPFVIEELALGQLRNREGILSFLEALPTSQSLSHDEILFFIEKHGLKGKGIGLVDSHLLGSALLTKVPLWTLDKNLAKLAAKLRVCYD